MVKKIKSLAERNIKTFQVTILWKDTKEREVVTIHIGSETDEGINDDDIFFYFSSWDDVSANTYDEEFDTLHESLADNGIYGEDFVIVGVS